MQTLNILLACVQFFTFTSPFASPLILLRSRTCGMFALIHKLSGTISRCMQL